MDVDRIGIEYPDVMVDIETTSTQPDRGGILQIAAVKFNLETQQICPDFFNMSLSLPKHRFWDMSTLQWWNRQKTGTLEEIMQNQRSPKEVMEEFAKKMYNPEQAPIFWSKPSHFDFMFISSYLSDYDIPNPFHYAQARDMRSYVDGLYHGMDTPWHIEAEVPFHGPAHNALYDTLHQIGVLFEFINRRKDV